MLHRIFDVVTGVTFVCSTLYTILPPWDGYADFPRFQRFYKAFVYTIKYMGINGRSSLYPSIAADPNRQTNQQGK